MKTTRIHRRSLALLFIAGAVAGPGCGGKVGEGELDPGNETAGSGGTPGAGGLASGGLRPASGGTANGGVPVAAGGRPSAGGRPVTGGAPPTGGIVIGGGPGTGAVPGNPRPTPQDQCYAQRGVYLAGTCYPEEAGAPACLKKTDGVTIAPERACACDACTFEYARCIDDGGCRFINACAELARCRDIASCQRSTCASLVEISGGPRSLGAGLFEEFAACMRSSPCWAKPL
jgi:hypothetical protein